MDPGFNAVHFASADHSGSAKPTADALIFSTIQPLFSPLHPVPRERPPM